MKLYAIWSIKTKGWVYDDNGICTYGSQAAAKRDIKSDLVHEKDYEVREYKR